MKNKLILAAVVIIMGFMVLNCSSGPAVTFESIVPDSTPGNLEGMWMHQNVSGSGNATIIFSGNSFSYQWNDATGITADGRRATTLADGNVNGRFTNDGRRITFFRDDGSRWLTPYVIRDEELNLTHGPGCWHWFGIFQKLDTNQNASLEGTWVNTFQRTSNGATYTFRGSEFFYTRDGQPDVSGTFEFSETKLTIKVSGVTVREYKCYFLRNGSQIRLVGLSGDNDIYFHGQYRKQ